MHHEGRRGGRRGQGSNTLYREPLKRRSDEEKVKRKKYNKKCCIR
jgi:hypothetical protein